MSIVKFQPNKNTTVTKKYTSSSMATKAARGLKSCGCKILSAPKMKSSSKMYR